MKFTLHGLMACFLLIQSMAVFADDEERLNYRVSYRGVFSAGSTMPIADVVLSTHAVENDSNYLETELSVTSEPYEFVESLYPIRYRFRSWYWRDRSASLASEYYEKTRATKHQLIYLDDPEKDFITRDVLKDGEADLTALHEGDYAAENGLSPVGRLTGSQFDRLGLLQRVRYLQLKQGEELELPVTNGKKLMRYRVKAESIENLAVMGKTQSALKMRFDVIPPDKAEKKKRSHKPVYIWLSDDDRRVPLKVETRQALGKFTLELTGPYPTENLQLAKAEWH